MAPKRILAAVACAILVVLGTAAFADEYRADEFFDLDLSRAVLSPKRLGPPAEFAPVRVEARTDARPVRTIRILRHANVAKPKTPVRAKLVRRRTSPLEAQAHMQTARIRSSHIPTSHIQTSRIQTWPCRSGAICSWK